jgi:hypothetical protein
MSKLRLSLDQLAVESFAVNDGQRSVGTVRGHNAGGDEAAITGWSWLCGTCNGATCGDTCDNGATCPESCGGDNHTLCNNRYCQTQTTTFDPAEPVDPATAVGYV